MAKIVQRSLNHQYIQCSTDVIVQNSTIPFDCYIKRHNDYVVIIEAGTYITEELFEKIQLNKVIYVLAHDVEQMQKYVADNKTISLQEENTSIINKAITDALNLSEALIHTSLTIDERLALIYSTTVRLMQSIFNDANEKLPMDALHACLIQIVKYADLGTSTMRSILKLLPDKYSTAHHSTNVAFFAVILAHAIDMSREEILDLGYTGLLHDIGKIRIDSAIIEKPSELNDTEFEAMKHHSEYGYMIVKENGIVNKNILNGVLFHHRRLDGSGYPQSNNVKIIPKYGQIIGMCDIFDALTTKRTFRTNYTTYEALLVIKQELYLQFNKYYINKFIELMKKT